MHKIIIGGKCSHGLPFSKAVKAGGFVYVSGQVAFDENVELVEGGIKPQTRQVFANIAAVLKEAGCSMNDIVKVNVWLDDARDFNQFNATYAEFFGDDAPARSTVESKLMIDAKIEVDCVAYCPTSSDGEG